MFSLYSCVMILSTISVAPENPRSHSYAIGLHFDNKKLQFFRKKCLFPPKFMMTFISDDFLFKSSTLIFTFPPFIDQKLRKQQLIPYFFGQNHLLSAKAKHSKRCIFRENSKNPRSGRKLQIYGENPRTSNAVRHIRLSKFNFTE